MSGAIAALARSFNVLTWEARLLLEPASSACHPSALSIDAHLGDVNALLDYFALSSAMLVGYCSGAALAIHAAARCARIERLALVNGAYFASPGECEQTQYERDVLDIASQVSASRGAAAEVHRKYFSARPRRPAAHEFGEEALRPYASPESLYRFGVALDHSNT